MVDAPVVFPEYNTGKILSPGSIEAYRWYICGFSGCTSEGDSAERKMFKGQDTQAEHHAEDAKLEKFDTQNRCRLRRHGNQQRIARPYHTQIARREELDNPLQIFQDHEFGSIAAELLLRFLQRFGGRADSFVCEFATKRIKYCSLSLVCCRISQIVLWVLRLVPSSKPSHHSYGMRSSTSNNNVSEFQSLFKDECIRDSLVFEQDLECRANEDVVGDTVYEDKIFECSNTYNMSDAVRSTSETEESTVHNLLATQDSAHNEEVDLLFDEPVELDLMDGNKESWRDSTVHPEINSGDSDDLFNPNVVDRKVSISKKPSNISRLCKNISSSLPKQILPPKMLAQEPSWALLSSEKCVQEVFDVALLMFDDIWKYMESTEACGVHYGTNERSEYTKTSDELKELLQKCSVDGSSPLQFDPLNFCLDVVKSLMSELIDMKLVSVDQLWNQWTLLRMGRQELVFESKLLLKLSRLSLLHSSTGREDSKTFSGTAGSGKLSVLSSLSSLLATSSTPRVQSTGSLSNREVATMLKQTPHEQYVHMLKEDRPATPPLCVYGESQILTAKQLKELRHKLPDQYKFSDWHLRYRMSSDGASLTTMLKLSPDDDTMLLVLLNSLGDVFGALITDKWKTKLAHSFYGSGTCNVWSFHQGDEVHMYCGTGTNEYYILVCEQYLALGSGGNFAIYLDSDLSKGCSGPCDTFGSPSLCASEEFSCVACELYSLKSNI